MPGWSRTEMAMTGMLAATVVGSVLAIGAVHLPVLLACATVTVIGVTLCCVLADSRDAYAVRSPAAIAALLLSGYTALQAVPLPIRLLKAIAPRTADLWSRALLPFHEPGPRWASISLDPGASTIEVIKWA